jgi:hypothetical protein
MPRSTPWRRRRTVGILAVSTLLACVGAAVGSDDAVPPPASPAGAPAMKLADLATHPVSPTAIYLQTGVIDTSTPAKGLEQHAGAKSAGQRFVIQLDGPMTPERSALLRDAGVVLGDYLPMNAWIVRLDAADPAKLGAIDFIRWHAQFDPVWKLSPELGRRNFADPNRRQLAEQGLSAVVVTLFDAEPADALLADVGKLRAAQVIWAEDWDGNMTINLVMPTDEVAFLALRPEVQFVEESPDVELRNSTVRWIIQTNQTNNNRFWNNGLTGVNQVVGILDGRVDRNHCSFVDTQPIGPLHRKILAYNASAGAEFHGTHVAGTAVGDSGDTSDRRGVAYNGKLVYNVIPAFNESSVLAALNTHHSQGARVHSNSWGDDGTTAYNSMCRGFDLFNWNNESSLVVLAVTNLSLLKNPENAKNLLAIGNSDDTPNQANHCTGGDGPTSDGRRKPEVYAPGCGTISANAGTACGTASATGTSMATPASAGLAMLMRQYFMDGYYPAGIAGSGTPVTPSAALLKSLMVNCAVDMTGVAGFPSNREGWGRLLGDNAIYFPDDTRKLVFGDVPNAQGFTTGQFFETAVNVVSSSEPLKITLVWTEPPAAAGAAFAAINNLNVTVTSPSGQVFRGNVFQGGQSAQGGTYDDRNNVEQVLVNTPTPGAWSVRIDAASVNVGPQGYAYSVTGDVVTGPVPVSISVSNPPPALRAPGEPYTVNVTVRSGDDTVVEGSAILHYRASGTGPFTDVPLTFVSGNDWRGVIPAAACSDEPQFYVSVQGATSGLRTSPAGAPASTFTSDVGTIGTVDTLIGDFSAGLPAGWTTSGLWTWTGTACAASDPCSAGGWAYYGRTAACNYDTGAANEGALTSPPITVAPALTTTLSYCSSLVTENNPSYDFAEVLVNGVVVDRAPESAAWQTRTVDISSFFNPSMTIAFRFRTGDAVQNGFRGWQVSNVRITSQSQTCTDPCTADWDHNGVVNSTDVSAFINDWFSDLLNGTTVTDFDGNGVVNSTDVSQFINEYFAAPPACTG